MQCGHSLCNQCLTTMCNHSRDPLDIICPMCRSTTPIENVSNVQSSRENVDATGITIKGSFSTKIENITLKLMELITEDPFVKVIIFSSVSYKTFCFVIMYYNNNVVLLNIQF